MRFSPTVLFFLSSLLCEHSVIVEAQSSKSSKKSLKNSKSNKSSKSSAETTEPPAMAPLTPSPTKPLSQAEKYFGVLPEDGASYIRIEETRGWSEGIPFFFGNPAILDTFVTKGVYSLEEVEMICKKKCDENLLCTSFHIDIGAGPAFLDGQQRYQCRFFNPSLGTVLITDSVQKSKSKLPEDLPLSSLTASSFGESTFFYKEDTLPPLPFEDFACDIGVGADGAATATFCLTTTDPEILSALNCPGIITEDVIKYFAPALTCVIEATENVEDIPIAIENCLGCLSEAVESFDSISLDPCVVNVLVCNDDASIPGASLFGEPNGICKDACPSDCVEPLRTAGLCTLSALPEYFLVPLDNTTSFLEFGGGCVANGIPGLDPFTCPPADFVPPTPEDYAAFLVAKSAVGDGDGDYP